MRWMPPVAAISSPVLAVLFTLLGGVPLRAQTGGLDLKLVMDESVFLPGEDIMVGVRISNLSGRALTFGVNSEWLTFYIETRRGEMVDRLGNVPVVGEYTLESSQAGTKWWNIQPYFDFDRTGTYKLYVEVKLPEWTESRVSEPVEFAVQSSRKIWETTFGVPPSSAQEDNQPEIRRYALQSATRRSERRLYARVSDESESRIYRVVMLDRLLSFASPEQQLDSASRLHVLFQTGRASYTYTVLNHDGILVVRQRYDILAGVRPRLGKSAAGDIQVVGGRRQPTGYDIPPYVPPPPVIEEEPAEIPLEDLPPGPSKPSRKRRTSTP